MSSVRSPRRRGRCRAARLLAVADAAAPAAPPARGRQPPPAQLPGQVERVVLTAGPLDRPAHRLRDRPHRRHQSRRRRRRRRPAARDPGRRQVARHRQPDRLEHHRSQALRPRRRAGDHDAAAAAARALPRRRHPRQRHRRSDHPLGSGLEQQRVAARRGDRAGQLVEGQSHQHAAAPERPGEPAGDAAGAIRRGQSPRAHGARRELRSSIARTTSGARRRSSSRRRTSTSENPEPADLVFSDFLNLFFFNRQEGSARVIKALQSKGFFQSLAEPNLIAYNGQEASFLAGGEIPDPDRAGRAARTAPSSVDVQGVRHQAHLHADDRRRRHPAEGRARSQHARLRQRHHAAGIPDPGALDAAREDQRRAAGRPVVRDCRPARQPDAGGRRRDSDPEPASRSSATCSRARPIAPSAPS